jgi:hypothetical protein
MPNYRTTQEAANALEIIQRTLEENQRDPQTFGLEARLSYAKGNPVEWENWIRDWQTAHVTHITLNTMGCGFQQPKDHLFAIEKFADWLKTVR